MDRLVAAAVNPGRADREERGEEEVVVGDRSAIGEHLFGSGTLVQHVGHDEVQLVMVARMGYQEVVLSHGLANYKTELFSFFADICDVPIKVACYYDVLPRVSGVDLLHCVAQFLIRGGFAAGLGVVSNYYNRRAMAHGGFNNDGDGRPQVRHHGLEVLNLFVCQDDDSFIA